MGDALMGDVKLVLGKKNIEYEGNTHNFYYNKSFNHSLE